MDNGAASDPGYMRASTARVEMQQIRMAMQALEEGFKRRNSVQTRLGAVEEAALLAELDDSTKDYDPGVVPYDVNKHILDYLPTPVVVDDDTSKESSSAVESTRNLMEKSIGASSKFLGLQAENVSSLTSVEEDVEMDPEFSSMFAPDEMRLLALVSHNNMKHSMKQFVVANKNVLKKFRLTGTNTTMSMLKEVFGEDPEVMYGPKCKSGPLGGDAQLVAMAVTSQLGACIFFIDPMDSHPHSADIECLVRQGNVHNILMMNNPTTAHICLNSLRVALKMGRMEMMPSFFFDLESPSVEAYKMRQDQVLRSTIANNSPSKSFSMTASTIVTAPTSILKAPAGIIKSSRREKNISEAMEKANRMSIEHHVVNRRELLSKMSKKEKSVQINLSESQIDAEATKSLSGKMEDFLPVDDKEVETSLPEKKKKKKKKKKLFGLIGVF